MICVLIGVCYVAVVIEFLLTDVYLCSMLLVNVL